MKLHDVDFYKESGSTLENFTVITSAPQTDPGWLVKDLLTHYNGTLIQLGVTKPAIAAKGDFLVITHTELPILSGSIEADELLTMLNSVRSSTKHLIVCVTLSDALVDPYFQTGHELARFATRLLFEAQLILQLRPLETGRARDITGRFIIARGPRNSPARVVQERELFYHVKPRSVEFILKH